MDPHPAPRAASASSARPARRAALVVAALALPLAALARAAVSDPGGVVAAGPDLVTDRAMAHAARLADGRVIVFGGHGDGNTPLATAETLDPADTGAGWTQLTMQQTHDLAFVARLTDGRFLLAGGALTGGVPAHADSEIFDPVAGTFTATGSCRRARCGGTAVTLTSGDVLLVGALGDEGGASHFGETWSPGTGTFSDTGALFVARAWPILVPTPDGGALVIGGLDATATSRVPSIEAWSGTLRSFSEVRSTLFDGETGWEPYPASDALRPVDEQQIHDGRHLFAAVRPSQGSEQRLFTVDAATGAVAPFDTTPALPAATTASIHATLVSPSGEEAYLLLRDRTAAAAPSYSRFKVATVTLRTGALDVPPDTFVAAGDHLPTAGGHILTAGGMLVFAGGTDLSAPDGDHASARTVLFTAGEPPPDVPPAPTAPRAAETGPARVEVKWTDTSSGEDGFHVEGRVTGAADWTALGDTTENVAVYTHTTGTPGESWEYRVASFNEGGASDWTAATAPVTLHAGKAAIPKSVGYGKVRISVEKVKKVWISNTDRKTPLAFGVTALTGDYFIRPGTDAAVIPPRKKFAIILTHKALAAGAQPGTLTLWTSDPKKAAWTVTLSAKAK